MHYLTRQRLHLSRFHVLMKVLLTLYITSVGCGLWVATLKYTDRAAWSADGARLYIAGDGAGAGDALGDPLAGTPEGLSQHPGLSRRPLIDIVHPHLFTVPIVLFILGHLLHLTRLPDPLKLALNVSAFASCLATFLLPLALRAHPGLAPLLIGAGTVFIASVALLCVIPLWETWFGRAGDGFDALPRQGP